MLNCHIVHKNKKSRKHFVSVAALFKLCALCVLCIRRQTAEELHVEVSVLQLRYHTEKKINKNKHDKNTRQMDTVVRAQMFEHENQTESLWRIWPDGNVCIVIPIQFSYSMCITPDMGPHVYSTIAYAMYLTHMYMRLCVCASASKFSVFPWEIFNQKHADRFYGFFFSFFSFQQENVAHG